MHHAVGKVNTPPPVVWKPPDNGEVLYTAVSSIYCISPAQTYMTLKKNDTKEKK